MTIQNSGITGNLFQTIALMELGQAATQLSLQQNTTNQSGTDCAGNINGSQQGSETQAVLSALEGNLQNGQTQPNYNTSEMDQLLAMECLLAQEQAQVANNNNGMTNPYDNGYNNGYNDNGCNNGYNDNGYNTGLNNGYNNGLNNGYASMASNSIANELRIGNEALLLSMLEQDAQANSAPTPDQTPPAQTNCSRNQNRPRVARPRNFIPTNNNSSNSTNFNQNSQNSATQNNVQETSFWSAGPSTLPWLPNANPAPVCDDNSGDINRIY